MKRAVAIALAFAAELLQAAACCIGGNPRTFIQLKRLQTYELGLSTAVRDVYGNFDAFGTRERTDGNQTYTISWGGGMRLSETWQAYAVLPIVHQINRYGGVLTNRTGPGDVSLGVTFTAVEQLFFDDWYPTVNLMAGAKLPTGRTESVVAGQRTPGAGNGLWEPYVGLGLRKDFEWVTLSVTATFGRPFGLLEGRLREGNRWELIESFNLPLDRRLSLGGGASQTWVETKSQDGAKLAGSDSRSAALFATATYFVTPLVELSSAVDFSMPVDKLAKNYPAYRGLAFTLKYGFY